MSRRRNMRVLYKCYECDQLSDKLGMAYDYKGGDYLRCMKCGAIEPGFEEIIEEETNDS